MAKIKRRTLCISGIILLIVVAFIFTFNLVVAKIIEKKIDSFLADEHLNHYHIKYTYVGFNLLNRSVSLTGFKYFPDSAFLESLDKSDINTIVPEISVGRLTVSGINFWAAIEDYNLYVRKITVKKPVIRLYKFNGKLLPANKEKKKKLSLDDSVRIVGIKGISVGTLAFNESKFEIYNYKLRKYVLTSKDITITMHNLTFKPSGYGNDYFYSAVRSASLVAKDNVLKLGNHLYEIAFTGIDYYRFLTKNEIRIRKFTISDVFPARYGKGVWKLLLEDTFQRYESHHAAECQHHKPEEYPVRIAIRI